MSLDKVFARGIRANASIGLLPWEKDVTQPIEVDVDVELDNTALLITGDLSKGADFDQILGAVREVASSGHIDLVESLADRIATLILERLPVQTARVQVRKYSACSSAAAYVGVEVFRRRLLA